MMTCAARLQRLKVSYGNNIVLDLPDLEFDAGRVHVLVGPNGAGKTTLLRVLAGLQHPQAGSVEILGCELSRLRGRERLLAMRKVSMCFQKPYLFAASVRRNVEYGLRARRLSRAERDGRVRAVMTSMELTGLEGRNARSLSAGEAQRVSLARVLALQPELVLLDEPAANVDQVVRPRVEQAIINLAGSGRTVVVATHDPEQAYRLSARVVRLERGMLAPPAVENLIEGEVMECEGAPVLAAANGVRIRVVTGRRGFVRAAVRPTDIIVSTLPVVSSARNCIPGRLVGLSETGSIAVLRVDAGLTLAAHITKESFAALGVTLDSKVFLTFKASAVTVF